MRVCPAGSPVKVHAPVCVSGFQHPAVRRQNIWHKSRRRLAECGRRLGLCFRRLICGVASADIRWSSV
jgi:hypothetical protein